MAFVKGSYASEPAGYFSFRKRDLFLATLSGNTSPQGAGRLFLSRFDTGLKTRKRQELNPDA
jgi:hypothetical protein